MRPGLAVSGHTTISAVAGLVSPIVLTRNLSGICELFAEDLKLMPTLHVSLLENLDL